MLVGETRNRKERDKKSKIQVITQYDCALAGYDNIAVLPELYAALLYKYAAPSDLAQNLNVKFKCISMSFLLL